MHKIEHGLWNVELTMPISDVFMSGYKIEEVKETLLKLRERSFEIRQPRNRRMVGLWLYRKT